MVLYSRKSTIRTLGLTSLLLLLICSSLQAQNIGPSGQPAAITILDSSKEQDGLTGSVRRVRTESAKLELKGERLVEGPRQLLEITTYGPTGKRVENVSYPSASALVGKEEYKYDDKGNIVEMTLRDDSGIIVSREAYDYEFDRFGNWTKMVTNLVVFEGGALKHEPIEVTYRALTYYFDDQIAKIVAPTSVQKMPEIPEATRLDVSGALAAGTGANTLIVRSMTGAPMVPLLESPPELSTPAEAEKTVIRSSPFGSNNLNASLQPKLTSRLEAEKTSVPATDEPEAGNDSDVFSSSPTRVLYRWEAESGSAPAPGEVPVEASKQPDLLNHSTSSANNAASNPASAGATIETVGARNIPAVETPLNMKGLEYFKTGRNRFEAGDLKGAVSAYLQSIELQPDSAEVYLNLGLVYLKLGKNKDAVKAFKESVRLDADVAESQYGLGLAYVRINRYKDAGDAFKRATVLRPDMAKAHYGLALVYQELGKSDALLAQFRILERLDPNLAKQLSQTFPEANMPCGFQARCK